MIVDVHAHLYPRPFMELVAAEGPKHGVSLTGEQPPTLCFEGIRFWRYAQSFHDVDMRLKQMDEAGVDRQVLSLGPPMAYWADADLGLRLCRIYNDEIARVVRSHPDRFVGFAALPLQAPALALTELERAVNDLGLTGVGIGSNVHGVQLDDPGLLPVFERLDALDRPLFIHPINPAGHRDIHDYRLDLAVAFPFETTIAAARLMFGGVLDACPRLRVCLAHLGGALPFLRERLALSYQVGPQFFGARFNAQSRLEMLIERFWFDNLCYYPPAFLAGIACVGVDRIVVGSDAPFTMGDLRRSIQDIRDFTFLPERDRARILGENALRYLGLAMSSGSRFS